MRRSRRGARLLGANSGDELLEERLGPHCHLERQPGDPVAEHRVEEDRRDRNGDPLEGREQRRRDPGRELAGLRRRALKRDHAKSHDHAVDGSHQANHRSQRPHGGKVGRAMLHLHGGVFIGQLHRALRHGQANGELAHARRQDLRQQRAVGDQPVVGLAVLLLLEQFVELADQGARYGDRGPVAEGHPDDQCEQVEGHRGDHQTDRAGSASHPRQERFVTTDPRHSGLAIQSRAANLLPFAFVLDGRRGAAPASAEIRRLLRRAMVCATARTSGPATMAHQTRTRTEGNQTAMTVARMQSRETLTSQPPPAPAAYLMPRHKSRPALTLPPAPHVTLAISGRPNNANRSRSCPKNDQPRPP